jgi:disulfide bond formation protein DsbB
MTEEKCPKGHVMINRAEQLGWTEKEEDGFAHWFCPTCNIAYRGVGARKSKQTDKDLITLSNNQTALSNNMCCWNTVIVFLLILILLLK